MNFFYYAEKKGTINTGNQYIFGLADLVRKAD